jgi:hypothetical protein
MILRNEADSAVIPAKAGIHFSLFSPKSFIVDPAQGTAIGGIALALSPNNHTNTKH